VAERHPVDRAAEDLNRRFWGCDPLWPEMVEALQAALDLRILGAGPFGSGEILPSAGGLSRSGSMLA